MLSTGGSISYLNARSFGVFHNVENTYHPTQVGPGMIIYNAAEQGLGSATSSLELATRSSTSNGYQTTVALTNIIVSDDEADFAIQVEDGEPHSGKSHYMREVARFTSKGNVGIGISDPTEKLTVAGTIETTEGGVKFPDGTVQTTAAAANSSVWNVNNTDINYTAGKMILGTETGHAH
jgi:hypothetical protein